MIDVMVLVFAGFILGAASYTAYSYFWQRRGRAEFRWLNLTSMLLSLVIVVAASPLLNIPGAVPLVLRGLGSHGRHVDVALDGRRAGASRGYGHCRSPPSGPGTPW